MAGILLLGAAGQLGQEFIHLLPKISPSLNKLHALDRQNGDICDFEKIAEMVCTKRPRVIINAAAFTAVDLAESEKEKAFAVNFEAVKNLAEIAKKENALLVHFSTDYVFDGKQSTPYQENDQTNAQNIYGQSKLKGEEAILKSGCDFLILRTSWVFGEYGNNFVKTMLRLFQEKEELNVVADQIGNPTSARFLAEFAGLALFQTLENPQRQGLYHLSNYDAMSWFDFAQKILNTAQHLNFDLKIKTLNKTTSQNFPQKTKRPKNSVLNCALFEKTFGLNIPKMDSDLEKMLENLRFQKNPRST